LTDSPAGAEAEVPAAAPDASACDAAALELPFWPPQAANEKIIDRERTSERTLFFILLSPFSKIFFQLLYDVIIWHVFSAFHPLKDFLEDT